MKVYISGKITDEAYHHVVDKFQAASTFLQSLGHEVVNPVDLISDLTMPWEQCMKIDIKELVGCDAIALLPCWKNSRGAKIEKQIASELGLHVLTLGYHGNNCIMRPHLTEQILFETIERSEGVSLKQLASGSREKPLPDLRRICMTLLKQELGYNDQRTANIFGCDRSTVTTARKKAELYLNVNKSFRNMHSRICRELMPYLM
jgi:DNA-binding CsgD family transcriptional regulator